MNMTDLVVNISEWGRDKGLHEDAGAQVEKFFEETGELARASIDAAYDMEIVGLPSRRSTDQIMDAIGDCAVVLIQIAEAYGLAFEECLEHAWDEIKDRDGETRNGVFVKEADL